MEEWSVRDERPYRAEESGSSARLWLAAGAVALAAAAGGYYYWNSRQAEPAASAPAASVAPSAGGAVTAPAAPSSRLPAPEAGSPGLPSLENSDTLMRQSIAGLVGSQAFEKYVVPEQLVRRIVVTVDNLPRQTAPRRMLPLNGVPGKFAATAPGAEAAIDRANFVRYEPFVRVLQAVNVQALVAAYVRAYPLFQRAYEEIGYPGKYFNDRLLAALDDLIAAPQDDAAKLIRPRVLYEFAEPDLETRSAGQKIMIRMGSENAAAVKTKLGEIRQAIVAASRPAR